MARSFGEIVTFYSYKGGTGRSMSMANVAHLLASPTSYGGKRVLVIDWDLEAPGLHVFFRKRFGSSIGPFGQPESERALQNAPGLIDYLTGVADFYRNSRPEGRLPESTAQSGDAIDLFRDVIKRFPLSGYVLPVDGAPTLRLMKAGRQGTSPETAEEYWQKVRGFDWEHFYLEYGSFFTHFRQYLVRDHDFVLIDSRTGLTDIGGICTRVMPEKLVVVFVPNRQNIDGVLKVARGAVDYRMRSRDPRSLMVFPLASRIDASASKLRNVWWRGGQIKDEPVIGYQPIFEKALKDLYQLDECRLGDYFDETQVPHDSDYAYGEEVAAWEDGTDDKFAIGHACDQLAHRLAILSAPWEALPGSAAAAGQASDGRAPYEGQADGIFISYRRGDIAFAKSVYEKLSAAFSGEKLFMDIDSVPLGVDFAAHVRESIKRAGVMLVMIGPGWTERIGEEGDFARLEVAVALESNVRIIPVLVGGAVFPPRDRLPDDLQGLAMRQAIVFDDERFDADMDRLIMALGRVVERKPVVEQANVLRPFPGAWVKSLIVGLPAAALASLGVLGGQAARTFFDLPYASIVFGVVGAVLGGALGVTLANRRAGKA